ncbi:MAG: 4Fe-4S binding protein [Candidatus Delongbacteria bacterium]|jgi:formate dehydrogenase subunit beta|nr:4Fe-4S binding protein [Candidatus Delongbacteria bacterium]
MDNIPKKGARLNSKNGIRSAIKDFFKVAVEKEQFNLVLMPMKVPSQDSYAWMMIKDIELLKDANPIAPIMPVNAANAIKRYTRKGNGSYKIAAIVRPCEIRAIIELVKLNQIKLDTLTLFSYDCVGALPMQDYIANPEKGEVDFNKIVDERTYDSKIVKDTCELCDKCSMPAATDLHFAIDKDEVILIPNSEKGEKIVETLDIETQGITSLLADWSKDMNSIISKRAKARKTEFENVAKIAVGLDNLKDTFANCIGCHNCNSVCPICYCRQCYFDSTANKPNTDFIKIRADKKGALGYPQDKIMFHVGRMAHMSLSCINCGLCSDACPVDIPVAKIFSYTGAQTQEAFDYIAGNSVGDALPMRDYKLEELGELKDLVKSVEAEEGDHE